MYVFQKKNAHGGLFFFFYSSNNNILLKLTCVSTPKLQHNSINGFLHICVNFNEYMKRAVLDSVAIGFIAILVYVPKKYFNNYTNNDQNVAVRSNILIHYAEFHGTSIRPILSLNSNEYLRSLQKDTLSSTKCLEENTFSYELIWAKPITNK
uniref:Uncharacterized protein n=1 Tax=Glossina brevipalpis TaxID=37001 RepID=A0A1A9W5F9_9MUSC